MRPEEKDLWERYFKTRDIKLRNELATRNLPLAKRLASKLHSNFSNHMDFEDVLGYANLGLIHAVETYDPKRAQFSTYAMLRMHTYTVIEVSRTLGVARETLIRCTKLKSFIQAYYTDKDSYPTLDELAKHFALRKKTIHNLQSLGRIIYPTPIECGMDLEEEFRDSSGQPFEIMYERYYGEVAALKKVRNLPDRERKIVEMHVFKRMSFRAIAYVFGKSHERIRQIYKGAVERLRIAYASDTTFKEFNH